MKHPETTVVIVPRETFSRSPDALERVLETTSQPFRLVYVDGGSPPAVAERLAASAEDNDFTLVRTDRYLVPNEARNIGFDFVETRNVAFIDNDLFPDEGWLGALERCLDETGGSVVGPLYCIGDPADGLVHLLGGDCRINETDGVRTFGEQHNHARRHRDVVAQEGRHQTELMEFHGVLMRSSVVSDAGGFDEELMAVRDHCDVCLDVQARGGTIWAEPQSVVTYWPPPRLEKTDVPYFATRWSSRWTRDSVARFTEKWEISDSDPRSLKQIEWADGRRRRILGMPLPRALGRPLRSVGDPQWRIHDWGVSKTSVRRAERERAENPGTRLVHQASWARPD